MSLIIRPATSSDAFLLTDLAAVTMRESFGPPHNPIDLVDEYIQSSITVPLIETELVDNQSFFFLLEPEGTPIGYVKLRRCRPPRRMVNRNAIEIQRIYLLKTHLGQGQGRMLMEFCLDWARNQGYTAVWLGVWERNERALGFYKRMGFEQFGFHYFQFGAERQRDFWLQKQLTT